MIDHALSLIIQTLNKLKLNTLLAIDEQTDVKLLNTIQDKRKVEMLSQRIDQYQRLLSLGFKATLNDYDLSGFEPLSFECLAIRIGKQKDISHHLINQSHHIVAANGTLIVAGGKTEGIKSLAKNLQQICLLRDKIRSKNQHEAYIFEQPDTTFSLNDHDYTSLRPEPSDKHVSYLSKPGVYGWQKVDKGSKLLIQSIAESGLSEGSNILDLGCGYGFLSIVVGTQYRVNITATDNNITAVNSCNANLAKFNCNGRAVVSNCADTITDRFDTVLCNPPFHTGFGVDSKLTERFIKAAKARLKNNGSAYFVVNSFIALEKQAQPYFDSIKQLASDNGFKVFVLSNKH